jgi:2-oxoisovalerate dehydrogenase E2 component (dihydrolipoyl transacylase)
MLGDEGLPRLRATRAPHPPSPRTLRPSPHSHVKVGDVVEQFTPICEVQSDKASVEITSRFDGRITAIHYKVGDVARVGSPLLDIDVADGVGGAVAAPVPAAAAASSPAPATSSAPTTSAPAAPAANTSAAAATTPADGERALSLATPAVRRIAKEHAIHLGAVRGTGPDGRILKGDVLAFVSNGGSGSSGPTSAMAAPVQTSSTPTPSTRLVPLTPIQRQMFKSMTASLAIPHFGFSDEVRMDALAEARARINGAPALLPLDPAGKRVKLSYMPFLIKALSAALHHHPILNARLVMPSGEGGQPMQLEHRAEHHVGIAMDTPTGLLVPSIKGVQGKSILVIAQELEYLKHAAAKGQLSVAELTGATITLSNIGNVGGTLLHPLLVPGQVCIGGLGRSVRQPRYARAAEGEGEGEEELVPMLMMPVSFNADHRIIDGATLARFVVEWKGLLEDPARLLVGLK